MRNVYLIFLSIQICLSAGAGSIVVQDTSTEVSVDNTTTIVNVTQSLNPLCNKYICKEGECTDGVCVCNYGYTTLKHSNSYMQCDYKRKERIVAVLLEFFFPIGIGHFYVGNYFLGILKLSLFIVILISISTGICFSYYSKNSVLAPFFVLCLSILLFIIWYLIDLVKFTFGLYLDGHKEKLL
jgi:hypothetical protein